MNNNNHQNSTPSNTIGFVIQQRYVLTLLLFFALVTAISVRVCLSLTITQMVRKPTASNTSQIMDDSVCQPPLAQPSQTHVSQIDGISFVSQCLLSFAINYYYLSGVWLEHMWFTVHTMNRPRRNHNHLAIATVNDPHVIENVLLSFVFSVLWHIQEPGQQFDWSQELQGSILASFYIGYIFTHIPGAMLAQKFGGKYVLALGTLFSAFASILTPVAVHWGGAYALMATRFVMGIFQGPLFPAISSLLGAWVPTKERGRLCSMAFSGMTVSWWGWAGSGLGLMCTGTLLTYWYLLFCRWVLLPPRTYLVKYCITQTAIGNWCFISLECSPLGGSSFL